jgi:hypothetical protein
MKIKVAIHKQLLSTIYQVNNLIQAILSCSVRFSIGSDDDDDKSSTVVALNQQTSSSDDDERQKSSNQVDNAQTTARELFGEADLSLSDDDDDDEDVDKNRQMTADDIVGPRLYPDPDDEVYKFIIAI